MIEDEKLKDILYEIAGCLYGLDFVESERVDTIFRKINELNQTVRE